MSLGTAMRAFLLTDANISTQVGAKRIHPLRRVEGETGDYITYQEISTTEFPTHDGPSGTVKIRMSVKSVSADYDNAHLLAARVRSKLLNGKGIWGGTVTVQDIQPTAVRADGMDPETGEIFVLRDYFVTYVL